MTIKEFARKVEPTIIIRIYDRTGYHHIEDRKAGDIHFNDDINNDTFYQTEIMDFTIYKNFVEVLI